MKTINLERIRRQLILGGVAPHYANRTILELGDHIDELRQQATNRDMPPESAAEWVQQQIGEEQTLINEVLAKPELRSWLSRHTGPALLAGPLLIWFGVMLLFIGGLATLNLFTPLLDYTPGAEVPLIYKIVFEVVAFMILHLTAPLLIVLTVIQAKKRLLRPGWQWLLGMILVAFVGAAWRYHFNWPTPTEQGNIAFSWGYSFMWERIRPEPDAFKYGKLIGMMLLAAVTWYLYNPYPDDYIPQVSRDV